MKYIVLLGDGMADEPIPELDGKTPLEHAHTPFMDKLAQAGETGLVHTIPDGFHPGSDVANLSVFGYNPHTCYSGRSPLEAASMGIKLAPEDVAFRLNLVHLDAVEDEILMGDFSAGHISTEEAAQLVQVLQDEFGGGQFNFYPGISYRHLMVWKNGVEEVRLTPPHDIIGQNILPHLPQNNGAKYLILLMNSSQLLFSAHAVNLARMEKGQRPANSIWLWGQGRAPIMATMGEKFGISGAVISAVDLIKGIGIYAGLDVIDVPGATGYLDTDYRGKAEAALEALKSRDFVYLHVEAPDEAGHEGSLEKKIKAIEDFDRLTVGTVVENIDKLGDYRILLLPDHPTPLAIRTHSSAPVPYVLFGSDGEFETSTPVSGYNEKVAAATRRVRKEGHLLIDSLIKRDVKPREI